MNNAEYLKVFLENSKISLANQNIEVDDKFFEELEKKYTNYDGDANEIGNALSQELVDYKQRQLAKMNDGNKEKDSEELEKEETEKIKEIETSKVLEKKKEEVAEKEQDVKEEKEEENKKEEATLEDEKKREVRFNNVDVNLMLIASASTPKELQEIVSKISNLKARLKDFDISSEEFDKTKRAMFDTYMNGLDKNIKNDDGLGFKTMEEYKDFADTMVNKYDTVILNNGEEIDSKDFNLKEARDDTTVDNKKEIEINEEADKVDKKDNIVEENGNKHEKETRDVVKEQVREQNDLDIMFAEADDNVMTKEPVESTYKKDNPHVKKLIYPDSEKGSVDTSILNITILFLLLIFFMLVLFTFL